MNGKKETLATSCSDKIKELILNGELAPGEKIKGDYLKNYLACGLSPIREALSRLVGTGVIELSDNIGFKVTPLSNEMIVNFYQSYAKVEKILFSESIINHHDEWESNLVTGLYKLAKIENANGKVEYSLWSAHNDKFHDALISGADLVDLNAFYKNLAFKRLWLNNCIYGAANHKLITTSHREHNKIAELALAGDEVTATALLYKHTMNSCEMLLSNFSK